MANKKDVADGAVDVQVAEAPAGYEVFTSASGAIMYVVPGVAPFSDEAAAQAYVKSNQAVILVDQFMAVVDDNLVTVFGNKDSVLPGGRALLAMKTRLRNNCVLFSKWLHDQPA